MATNEHGRSLIELIRAIRACRACFPQLYITCPEHQSELDRLYPEPCPDPQCPACTPADRHDITTYGDQADGWKRVELVDAPGRTPRVERTPADSPCTCAPHPIFGHEDACRYVGMGARPVHDNGDYHV